MNPADYRSMIPYGSQTICVGYFYTEAQTRDHPGTWELDFDLFDENGLIVDVAELSHSEIERINRAVERHYEQLKYPDQGDRDD